MLTEQEVTRRAITWLILSLHAKELGQVSGPSIYGKASAYVAVLDLPKSMKSSKRSADGIGIYAKAKFNEMMKERAEQSHFNVNAWIKRNINLDFENYI